MCPALVFTWGFVLFPPDFFRARLEFTGTLSWRGREPEPIRCVSTYSHVSLRRQSSGALADDRTLGLLLSFRVLSLLFARWSVQAAPPRRSSASRVGPRGGGAPTRRGAHARRRPSRPVLSPWSDAATREKRPHLLPKRPRRSDGHGLFVQIRTIVLLTAHLHFSGTCRPTASASGATSRSTAS